MILGLVGILGSPIIFLNNLTAIAAGLGIILGLIAVFGTKRILALIGVGLGIAAIAITVNVQQAAVEVSKPAECQPSEYAAPTKIDRAVKVTVTVVNGSDEAVNTVDLAPSSDAVFNGKTVEAIFDSEGDCGEGMATATVLPGKTYTFDAGYSVGSKPGELQLVIDPMLGQQAADPRDTAAESQVDSLFTMQVGEVAAHLGAERGLQRRRLRLDDGHLAAILATAAAVSSPRSLV